MRERFLVSQRELKVLIALFVGLAISAIGLIVLAVLAIEKITPPGIFKDINPQLAIVVFSSSIVLGAGFLIFMLRVNKTQDK